MEVHQSSAEPWRVTLVDTGEQTQTGGRLRRVLDHVGDEEFCFTYGDGLSAIDIGKLIAFHRDQAAIATVTAVQPPGRFGALEMEDQRVHGFEEKPHGDGGWINGGFFVLSPEVGRYIERRHHDLGARADGAPRRRGPTRLIPLRRLLASDGHAARQALPRGAVGVGRGALEEVGVSAAFWRDSRVLLTGHTGFKGSWLALWLHSLGAEVTGYALAPPTDPSLYELARVGEVAGSLRPTCATSPRSSGPSPSTGRRS